MTLMSDDGAPTEDAFRDLARSSHRLWKTLEFEHTPPGRGSAHAWIRRPFDLSVETADSEVHIDHRGSTAYSEPAANEPSELMSTGSWMEGDPFYGNYQWVALLRPTELADGQFREEDYDEGLPTPAGTTIRQVYAEARFGRDTWWAELSPASGRYDPRCSCCPLLYGRESIAVERMEGNTRPSREDTETDFAYASRFLVGLDAQTGVCVSVDHLDGSEPGEAFSVRILAVDEPMGDDLFARPPLRS